MLLLLLAESSTETFAGGVSLGSIGGCFAIPSGRSGTGGGPLACRGLRMIPEVAVSAAEVAAWAGVLDAAARVAGPVPCCFAAVTNWQVLGTNSWQVSSLV